MRVDVRELERAERQLAQLLQRLGDRHAARRAPPRAALADVPDPWRRRHDTTWSAPGVPSPPREARSATRFSCGAWATSRSSPGSTFRMLATSVSSANGLRTSSLARSGRCTCSALQHDHRECAAASCRSSAPRSTSHPDTSGIIRSRITRSAPGRIVQRQEIDRLLAVRRRDDVEALALEQILQACPERRGRPRRAELCSAPSGPLCLLSRMW